MHSVNTDERTTSQKFANLKDDETISRRHTRAGVRAVRILAERLVVTTGQTVATFVHIWQLITSPDKTKVIWQSGDEQDRFARQSQLPPLIPWHPSPSASRQPAAHESHVRGESSAQDVAQDWWHAEHETSAHVNETAESIEVRHTTDWSDCADYFKIINLI